MPLEIKLGNENILPRAEPQVHCKPAAAIIETQRRLQKQRSDSFSCTNPEILAHIRIKTGLGA